MSHIIGTIQTAPTANIGPDFGPASNLPDTWSLLFAHTPAPTGTKFVILHFSNVILPANNRLEVDLGYDTDVFTSLDGGTFYTRPVNIHAFAGGLIPIRYITNGAATGGAQLDSYGRGERHIGEQDPTALSNCDVFLQDAVYTEPKYDPYWYCNNPPNWENVAAVGSATDVRTRVARSVGIIITVEENEAGNANIVSSCSVTLVDADKVLTAGHCHTPEEALSASVTFDYEVAADGSRLPGYNPLFYKVTKVLGHQYTSPVDYSLLQLSSSPPGLAPIQMRHDLPAVNEQVFGIHHPNGAVKKLSVPHPGFDRVTGSGPDGVTVPPDFSVSGGSSGSGLFDMAGRITGILSNGGQCENPPLSYYPTASILSIIAPAPPVPITRDVVVVFDRSGSMSYDDGTGRPKIDAARDALSLFVKLVLSGTGNRLGLISFSTVASSPADFSIAGVTTTTKNSLIGTAPYITGIVGGLIPGGATSIGDGLDKAHAQFPTRGLNPRAILLMTDGLENTPPMISSIEPQLAGIDVHAIGFGSEANLDGAKLNALAMAHNGLYTRAESGLALEKFFSHAFGNIFEAGIIIDPEFDLPSGEFLSPIHSFNVWGEEGITVVAGWDLPGAPIFLIVRTPGGTQIISSTPGIEAETGNTWAFIRLALPFGAERNGTWSVQIARQGGGGEFPPTAPALHYFFNVIPSGGAVLRRANTNQLYYSGDTINPIVMLRFSNGGWPRGASVTVSVSSPNASAGNLLYQKAQQSPVTINGDTIPARQSSLRALYTAAGKPLINYVESSMELSEDPRDCGGGFEESGVFGKQMDGLLTMEGNYTFHVVASYGLNGRNSRELLWTVHVDVGIDPSHTKTNISGNKQNTDGTISSTITIVPSDKNGNYLGPGRAEALNVSSTQGTIITGPVTDMGDGSYTIPVTWNPSIVSSPGMTVSQPGRTPVIIKTMDGSGNSVQKKYKLWFLLILFLLIIILLLILLLVFR